MELGSNEKEGQGRVGKDLRSVVIEIRLSDEQAQGKCSTWCLVAQNQRGAKGASERLNNELLLPVAWPPAYSSLSSS